MATIGSIKDVEYGHYFRRLMSGAVQRPAFLGMHLRRLMSGPTPMWSIMSIMAAIGSEKDVGYGHFSRVAKGCRIWPLIAHPS